MSVSLDYTTATTRDYRLNGVHRQHAAKSPFRRLYEHGGPGRDADGGSPLLTAPENGGAR